VAHTGESGDKRLVAYVTERSGSQDGLNVSMMRRFLHETVPDFMIPSMFMLLEAMPKTPSGKIDRRALPEPGHKRPSLTQEYVAAGTSLEKKMAQIWQQILSIDEVGIHDNFFDLGGNSLLSLQTIARFKQAEGIEIPVVKWFQYPTIHSLCSYLSLGHSELHKLNKILSVTARALPANTAPRDAVAIIGMSGRFPGAANVEELWGNLCAGRETISFFSDDELDSSISSSLRLSSSYIKARGVVAEVEKFDAKFWGIPPREAEMMDPQQRLFFEVSYEAFEDAGYIAESYDGLVGVYAGTGNNTYYHECVQSHPDRVRMLGAFQTMVANEKDYVATRLAYKLNLTGPCVSVHTACSTSLVAICEAFESLVSLQCDMAIAGGASVTVPVKSGYLYQEGGMLLPDGHTRPFDINGQGTVFSDGAGAVVLKRLEDAKRDGDQIYAVIRGVAVNNDGSNKVSFTAPSVEGQASVIAMAQARAGIDSEKISYVEAHGTATPLGDPIEVEALSLAFRMKSDKKGFCALGSIKSNIGHLTAAAGVAGLIKTALSLKNKVIPPTVHFKESNPKLNLEESPFFVNPDLIPWAEAECNRCAGVSSFGVGGTNAHVILEEPPAAHPTESSRPCTLLLISGKSENALEQATEQAV